MYQHKLHGHISSLLKNALEVAGKDNGFYTRFLANASVIQSLFNELYQHHAKGDVAFRHLLTILIKSYQDRSQVLRRRDDKKEEQEYWYLSNEITGMSLYVDRFAGT